jgi:hypothetical protein
MIIYLYFYTIAYLQQAARSAFKPLRVMAREATVCRRLALPLRYFIDLTLKPNGSAWFMHEFVGFSNRN